MKNFDLKMLADPQIYAVNTLPAHSSHKFTDGNDESLTRDLCGDWLFCYSETPEESPAEFFADSFDCSNWDTVKVPGHIQLQGYGAPHYTNTPYPWDGWEDISPGEIPTAFNPTGSYVKEFTIAENEANRPWFIRFDGAESALALWCNGEFVGYSEDSFTPSSFDLSAYIRAGTNKLAAQVYRFSSGSWLEDQDFWRFSGIFREVTLYTLPKTHVFDLKNTAVLNDDYSFGEVSIELTMEGELSGTAQLKIGGQTISAPIAEKTILQTNIPRPLLWSAEEPNLYPYEIRIIDENGAAVEIIKDALGFRRFELRDGLMKINGKRILFKGVNRHEWDCRTGRCITRETIEKDIINMKRNNINAIRTSHYPNRIELYELCDKYGMYVIDEANLETHGSWMVMGKAVKNANTLPGDREEWLGAVLDRANNMYQRDKNHPSILIWSCGNESYGGKNLYEMSRFFRETDPSRLVHYEGVFHDRSYNDTSDMESQMYSSAADVVAFLRENPKKPFIMCEYSHAMGNSLGGISRYTELAEIEPRYQGGFIWDYIDQALMFVNPLGKESLAYGGDFGDRPTDYNFSCNGLVFADRRNTPKMQEVKGVYQPFDIDVNEDSVAIKNNNLFAGTENLKLRLSLTLEGDMIADEEFDIDISPGASALIPHFLRPGSGEGEYVLTAAIMLKENTSWAETGHEIAFGQGVLRRNPPAPRPLSGKLIVTEGDVNIGVRDDDFSCMFQKSDGKLVSLKYGAEELIINKPSLNFWRAPVENDFGWNMSFEMDAFRFGGESAQLQSFFTENSNNRAHIRTVYLAPDGKSRFGVNWDTKPGGIIRVELIYLGNEPLTVPEFGMMFRLPASYKHAEYYGLGPEENVIDRSRGARLGRYRFNAAENLTPYVFPQDCGARTGVRWMSLFNDDGSGICIETEESMTVTALPYTPQQLENAAHDYELPGIYQTVLRVSSGQMGVGGDDSWGAKPHKDDMLRINPNESFVFTIRRKG